MHPDPLASVLQRRVEDARLDTLALRRALDQVADVGDAPPSDSLRRLEDLDASCAAALWALRQPPGTLSLRGVAREISPTLDALEGARETLRQTMGDREVLAELEAKLRAGIDRRDAYLRLPADEPVVRQPPHRAGPRVGRNEPCPCGSGKKHKKCCALASGGVAGSSHERLQMVAGSYGGPGRGYFPSIRGVPIAPAGGVGMVLVKRDAVRDTEDEAVDEASADLAAATGSGAEAPEVAQALSQAGYLLVEDPRLARD